MTTTIIFIIVLAILIFVHELGHFIAARASGVRVDAFKLGFGPRICAWKRGETEYGVNLIPFGGYVKIHGENPDQESVSGTDAARSFVNKSRWKQVMILVAGVTFNFVFAWMLYAGGFMFGVTATNDGFEQYVDRFTDERIMITYIAPDSPAAKSGLVIGDVITGIIKPASVSSSDTYATATTTMLEFVGGVAPIGGIQDFIDQSRGKLLRFGIRGSDGVEADVSRLVEVTPAKGLVEGRYAVGIGMQLVGDLRLPFFSAVIEGLRYTGVMIRETAVSLGAFVLNIFQGTAKLADVTGPVGIAGIVGDAADLGFTYLLMITALISINLGVINLVPFPALDGGRILFVLIEGAIRRRIPMKFANWTNAIGFGLLMILMIVITFRDVAKLFR